MTTRLRAGLPTHNGEISGLALAPYAPELNPVEHLWDELREKCFHNKVFNSIDALEDDLALGLLAMENTPEVIKSITNWPWIIDVL
jgi:transposase